MSDMNAMEALAREIGRVTKLCEQYAAFDGMLGVNVKPARALMVMSLEEAKVAVGSNDPLLVMKSLTDLREYEK